MSYCRLLSLPLLRSSQFLCRFAFARKENSGRPPLKVMFECETKRSRKRTTTTRRTQGWLCVGCGGAVLFPIHCSTAFVQKGVPCQLLSRSHSPAHRVLLLEFLSTVYRPSLNIDINRNCCCFKKPKTLLSFVDDMKKHPMFGGHPGV